MGIQQVIAQRCFPLRF